MNIINHACIPSGLFKHPDFCKTGKRATEQALLAGFFASGYQYLSLRRGAELVNKLTRANTSIHHIKKSLNDLENRGWIKTIDKGSYFRRLSSNKKVLMATTWEITEKLKTVCLQSKRFYKSLSAYRNRKPIKFDETPSAIITPDAHESWKQMLPDTTDTKYFISGLSLLEDNKVFFDKKTALYEYYRGNIRPKRIMPIYGITSLKYKPLKTGRMQSDPHAYLGKALVPFITPAEDKHLEHGTLFSLDFSSQEIRLLSSYAGGGQLKRDVKYEDNLFETIHRRLPNYLQDVMGSLKQHFYAITYGSNGQSLTEYLHDRGAPMDIANSLAKNFLQEIDKMYPEIKNFQRQIERELIKTGKITAPGGVIRCASNDGGLTLKNIVNKNYARQTALSHYIQGAGATITRHIVARAVDLKHCRLHIPIHDGFVFYATGDLELAIQEAENLMRDCAALVCGEINMPVKMEWKRDKDGLKYYK